MDIAWLVIAFLSVFIRVDCGRYEKPSSYHNQVRNHYDDDFLWPKYFSAPRKSSYEDMYYPKRYPSSYMRFNDPSYYGSYSNDISSNEISSNDISEALHDELGMDSVGRGDDYFSYDENSEVGPSNWWKINENCSGRLQSPVRLYESLSFQVEPYEPLTIKGFAAIPKSVLALNTGHSMAIRLNYGDGQKPVTISGGPLKVPYFFDNVHWHWGGEDNGGSEHYLNGRRYAAEIHLVCWSSKYSSLLEAATKPGGLAVLAFFYELDNSVNEKRPFMNLLPSVIEPYTKVEDSNNVFCVKDLIKSDKFAFLSYKGSLTTPNCYETVTWLVSKNILKINSEDLAKLRQLKDSRSERLTKNARPLQRLNRRKITSYPSA